MRVIKSYKHAHYVVELFQYGEKYTLKIKDRGIEQSYPVPEEFVSVLDDELNKSSSELYEKIAGLFEGMHYFWGRTLLQMKESEGGSDNGGKEEEIV